MATGTYTDLAPEIRALVDAGEISAEYAQNNLRLALLCVGFITRIAGRRHVQEMYEANDREHFIEGIRASWLESEWFTYLNSIKEAPAPA